MENNILKSNIIDHPCNYIIINYSLLNWELPSNQLYSPSVDIHMINYNHQSDDWIQNNKLIV
jgi:hypothetical protein